MTNPLRLLIVDDDDTMRSMLRILLGRDERFDVVGEAANGREAVEVATETQPDMIVLDQDMPEMTGLEAMSKIRENAPEAKVIMFSGCPRSETKNAAIEQGAVAYISKGPQIAELRDAIVQFS